MTFLRISTTIFDFIDRKSVDKLYAFKFSLILVAVTCIAAFPEVFTFFFETKLPEVWESIFLKASDLTNNLSHITPYDWRAKKVFRLTFPVLIRLFSLSPTLIIVFQIISGYFIFYFSYKLFNRLLHDAVQSTFLTAGLAFIYFGKAAYFEHDCAWFDSFSFLFLIMAMYHRNPVTIFLFSTLTAWNDERAFMALSIVFLFHLFENISTQKISIKSFVSNNQALSVLFSIIFYGIVRVFLMYKFQMRTPEVGANLYVILDRTYEFIPIGLLTFFEGYWLMILLSGGLLLYQKKYLLFSILAAPLFVFMVIPFCVIDITRSGSFAVPIIFILARLLQMNLDSFNSRIFYLFCLLFSLLIPPIFVCPDWKQSEWFAESSIIRMLVSLAELIN